MHKKFTFEAKRLIAVAALALFNFILPISDTYAQVKWSGVYGNEWLAGKYGQAWVKIGVTQKGMHKVTLPIDFRNKPGQLHLYHRGVEVSIASASSTEIEFYGVPNDGDSDALLYRPYTGTRANPYYSWFSDESSYFLTYSTSPAKLAVTQPQSAASGSAEPYHIQRDVTVYSNDYTHDETTNPASISLDNSFFQDGKAATGQLIWKYKPNPSSSSFIGDSLFTFPFKLNYLYEDPAKKPQVEVLINGRTYSGVTNKVRVSRGKSTGSLTSYPDFWEFSGFNAEKRQFTLDFSASNPGASDIAADGSGVFSLACTFASSTITATGAFSVTYLKFTYPQGFDMSNTGSAIYNLIPTNNAKSLVRILNAPSNAKVYDITSQDTPRIIPSTYDGTTLVLMIDRVANQELNLYVTNSIVQVDNSKIQAVTFTEYAPANNDYLIITNSTLSSAANNFAAYRKSATGGGYSTLVTQIKDIYNQFNYGEPSPVAIRRYVDYMVRNNARDKHNLLLIGPSTTIQSRLKLHRELNEEVPTIGYPGSDVLLVEGLTSGTAEVPSIPIGRISATTTTQVENYLQKVKDYEAQYNQNLDWRKKVYHVSGGLKAGENTRFAKYLSDYNSLITGSPFSGNVTPKVKPDGDYGYPSSGLNIHSEVNSGIGALVYYGHGSPTQTDYNIGYISDGSYNNTGKYPFLYFNGCGVGNLFSGRFSAYPTSTDQIPLSSDWLLGQNKGSIANIANSYYAFEEASHQYIGALYENLYKTSMTIGQIHKAAAKIIMDRGNASSYDIASNHQSLLHGDPALRLLLVSNPLPVDLKSFGAKLMGDKVQLDWVTAWERNNSHFKVERSYNAKNFQEIGRVEGKVDSDSENFYSFIDSDPIPGVNYYRLAQVDGIGKGEGVLESKISYSKIVSVELPSLDKLFLSPNPTTGNSKIEHMKSMDIKSWNLIDIKGNILQINGVGNDVNLSNYPVGEYILEIKTSNGDIFRKKLIKQ